jgi:hypothetical protein
MKIQFGKYCHIILWLDAHKILASPNCGMTFRRVLDLSNDDDHSSTAVNPPYSPSSETSSLAVFGPLRWNSLKRERDNDHGETDGVSLFRRVRIYNITRDLILPDLPGRLWRATLYELGHYSVNDMAHQGRGFIGIRVAYQVNNSFRP